MNIYIRFEDNTGKYPDYVAGPFEWIEVINNIMQGLSPGDNEAEQIAGQWPDRTWDSGPKLAEGELLGEPRNYTRFTIFTKGIK